jgi:hypothetical protein
MSTVPTSCIDSVLRQLSMVNIIKCPEIEQSFHNLDQVIAADSQCCLECVFLFVDLQWEKAGGPWIIPLWSLAIIEASLI